MSNDNNLSWPEVVANPKHDESKNEEVVQDKMTGDVGRGCDKNIVTGEEVPDIADLREKK